MTLACVRQFLYDWQTLITGALALLAAIATIRVMRAQASIERHHHNDAIYRKGLAARAQMPDALSGLSQFTEVCVSWANRREKEPPKRPIEAVDVLKSGIEFVDNVSSKRIYELVSFYQVHNARLFAYVPPIHGLEAADRLYDTARLRCLIDSLFPFGRNEVANAPQGKLSKEEMISALRILVSANYRSDYEERYDKVCEMIAQRHS